jgi:Leucine-rich repeat (LRR) protein
VLDSLLSLEKLIIERTPLVQLPSLIFCQSLRTLHIDETLVGEISHGAFVDLPRLKVVQITNSLLKNFQDRAFLNLPALELLNLTGNHLSIINPSGWAQLPQLKVVDVRNNKLREIYSIFSMLSNFKKLKTLHLDHNQITDIGVAFEAFNFPELNAFTISYNLIEHFVSAQYKNWPSLRFLDLSFNQLSSFPLSLLAKTPQLKDLSLAGNPLMKSSFDVRISSILSELPRLRLLNLDHCGIIKITQQTIGVRIGKVVKLSILLTLYSYILFFSFILFLNISLCATIR